ncbi:hypothetical protein ACFSR7_03295 [Cohnella sp. GCM10020058]|uniref:hypothetical protein n=1 Tax=Cohnella sp. GCM10020058 TaxID=3317330 RepID=UPI00364301AA
MTDEGAKKTPLYVREENFNYDKYAELADDVYRYEVLDGVLELMFPGPNASHQSVSIEAAYLLKQSCNSEYLVLTAPIDVVLSPENVVKPDLVLIHRSRLISFHVGA